MGIALPPAIAGRLHAHEARVLAVLHVANEDAVFDQHGAIGRRALIIDRERAAALCDGAVVHHRHALRCNTLPPQAGEGRSLLAVEVAFEAVAHRLVQHDARPTGPEHHVHLAGRGRDSLEIDQGLAHGIIGHALPGLGLEKTREALAAAIAVAAGFLAFAVAGDNRDVHPHERAHVAVAFTVGAQDLDHLPSRAEGD